MVIEDRNKEVHLKSMRVHRKVKLNFLKEIIWNIPFRRSVFKEKTTNILL